MKFLFIALVLLFGGVFIYGAVSAALSRDVEPGWRKWATIAASGFVVIGGLGFFGSALSAGGGLNWLPRSFEWPVGYTDGAVSTPTGMHIVPLTPSGRVQVYDANWTFVTGWFVDAGGGPSNFLRRQRIESKSSQRAANGIMSLISAAS